MTITAIEPKRKGLSALYIDGEFIGAVLNKQPTKNGGYGGYNGYGKYGRYKNYAYGKQEK